MKTIMKRTVAVLLLGILLLTLTACGNENVRGTVESNTNNATATTTAPPEADDASEAFSLGSSQGSVYKSEFIGIGCEVDATWTLYDDAQIRELNQLTMDAMSDEYAAALENAQIVYDMYAMDTTTGNSINVNLENLGLLYGATLSEADYVDLSLTSIKDALGSMGMENITAQATTVTMAGKERSAIQVQGSMAGISLYETVVCIKCGSYMACITVATMGSDQTADLLAKFYAL